MLVHQRVVASKFPGADGADVDLKVTWLTWLSTAVFLVAQGEDRICPAVLQLSMLAYAEQLPSGELT